MAEADPQPPPAKQRRTLEDKLRNEVDKHPLREPCDCPRSCISAIIQRRRVELYLQFWELSYNDRKNFIHQTVKTTKPQTCSPAAQKKRQVTYFTHNT